ncbi:hypothetical protein [uncultured Gimesia sp.]|uniref:hypothetical protein n=1 Tax=uncultured Gimesia sp. TaxID=1678688 RepID=UPI0030DB4C33
MNGLRLIWVLCISTLLLGTQTGCQGLANKMFRLDSNSRSPFLGLEFYTNKDKPAAIQNVSQLQPVELEPAILQTKAEEPSRFSKLPKWLNPMSKKSQQEDRIPLPRTDLAEKEVILEEPADDLASGDLGSSLEDF